MKRLTVDTDLSFCDIAQCDSIPGGSFCEGGSCDQRKCYEKHWGCPYGNEGMTDCAVLLEAAYEDTIEKLLALKETLEG